jgi:hypothetical protein
LLNLKVQGATGLAAVGRAVNNYPGGLLTLLRNGGETRFPSIVRCARSLSLNGRYPGGYQPQSVPVFISETCSQTDSATRPWVRCCFHPVVQLIPLLKLI